MERACSRFLATSDGTPNDLPSPKSRWTETQDWQEISPNILHPDIITTPQITLFNRGQVTREVSHGLLAHLPVVSLLSIYGWVSGRLARPQVQLHSKGGRGWGQAIDGLEENRCPWSLFSLLIKSDFDSSTSSGIGDQEQSASVRQCRYINIRASFFCSSANNQP